MKKTVFVLVAIIVSCIVVTIGNAQLFPGGGSRGLVRTQKPFYAPGENILVQFNGMSGSTGDWITIVASGTPADNYGEWFYTNGARSGTNVFKGFSSPGTYEVRAYFNWPNGGYNIQGSCQFQVGGGGGGGSSSGQYDYSDFYKEYVP